MRSRGWHEPRRWSWPKHCLVVASLLASLAPGDAARALESPRPVKSLLELRHERVIVQNWDLSCGAAALATILRYQYGEAVTERDVARALISRDKYLDDPSLVRNQLGFSLLDLKKYVDGRGYKGIGYGQLELDDLIERAPAIVPIHANGSSHFVVFRGIRGNRVLLADPAWGNRTLTIDAFEDAWLSYPEFGRVGFVVALTDSTLPSNRLEPRAGDFVFLR